MTDFGDSPLTKSVPAFIVRAPFARTFRRLPNHDALFFGVALLRADVLSGTACASECDEDMACDAAY